MQTCDYGQLPVMGGKRTMWNLNGLAEPHAKPGIKCVQELKMEVKKGARHRAKRHFSHCGGDPGNYNRG